MRTLTATIAAAITQETTKPIYLIRMGWAAEVRAATWASAISWNAETWSASGITISGLDSNGGRIVFPNGDSDPWLALVMAEGARNKTIKLYEHQTNYATSPNASDATLVFDGIMDSVTITESTINVDMIESATNKAFPSTSIDRPTYTYLLSAGTRIVWGDDVITVN